MTLFDELRHLEQQGIDLIEIVGQDRHLESPAQLQELVRRLGSSGGDLCAELLFLLTYRRFPTEEAEQLWAEISRRRREMASALRRDVSFRVAALDYLSAAAGTSSPTGDTERDGLIRGARIIDRAEFEKLLTYVNIDEVTSAYTRRYFQELIQREFHRARRYGHSLSLLLLDVDDFKRINDEHGHVEGDAFLRKLARRLKAASRATDGVCRFGGDEFAIVLPETDSRSLRVVADRIVRDVREMGRDEPGAEESSDWGDVFTSAKLGQNGDGADGSFGITVSVGGATYPTHVDEIEELIALADQMCLEAKRAGKNQARISDAGDDWTLDDDEAESRESI